jgi:hypothetical protein
MQIVTPYGKAYPLKLGLNTVGRGGGNDIVLDNAAMSRQHAELHWDGQRCIVVDLGSTNGTFLNGQRLVPGQPQSLPSGARLSFGPTMTVTLLGDAAEASSSSPEVPRPSSPVAGLDLIFRALDVALDYRKLGLAFLGLLLVGLVGAGFVWISAQVSADSAVLGIAIGLLGLVAVWLAITFVVAALSRLSLVELKEGTRGAVREALGFAGQHFLAFLFSPLLLVVGLALVLVAESILLLIGRVEYVGEVVVSLAFLPLALLNLGLIVVAWFGTALTFPVVADQGGGVRDTLAYVLAVVRRVPGRLIAYMVLVGIASLAMLAVSFYLVFVSLYTTSTFAAIGMGPGKFAVVLSGLPLDTGFLLPSLSYESFSRYWLSEPPLTHTIARLLFGLSFSGLAMLALAIPQLFYLASTCAVYLGLGPAVPELGRGGSRAEVKPSVNPRAPRRKACWYCGASLAYDQSYCPHCGNMQR